MRILLILYLLNICSHSDAQIRKDKQVFNAVMSIPRQATISGENILIYSRGNMDSLYNYSLTAYPDSAHFRIHDMPLKIKPKTGVWYKPFCAYPLDEESVINGSMIPDLNSTEPRRQSEGNVMIKYNGVSKEYKLWTTPGKKSIPSSGCIFNCKKLPSLLIFGDLADTKNQFVVTFK
jgi:hypothetical protein